MLIYDDALINIPKNGFVKTFILGLLMQLCFLFYFVKATAVPTDFLIPL